MSDWRAIIERDVLSDEEFLLVEHIDCPGGTVMSVAPLVMVPRERGTAVEPTMAAVSGDLDGLLQAILDAAWARGMRPKGFEGPQELKAVNRHLEDMRRLAFHAITAEKA